MKYVAIKSKGKYEKAKPLQAEEEEFEEISEEEDELYFQSRRVNQLWKKRQTKFKGYRRTCGQSELTSGEKKYEDEKDVTCFKFEHPGHYKNECPKLMPKTKFFREKKKVLMATYDDSKDRITLKKSRCTWH